MRMICVYSACITSNSLIRIGSVPDFSLPTFCISYRPQRLRPPTVIDTFSVKSLQEPLEPNLVTLRMKEVRSPETSQQLHFSTQCNNPK